MEILKNLADNPALLDAVRKTLEKQYALENINTALPNTELGELVRAKADGLKMLAEGFREIERYKTVPKREEGPNPAR